MPTENLHPDATQPRAVRLFVMFSLIVLVGVISYGTYSRRGGEPGAAPAGSVIAADTARIAAIRERPHLVFRITALGPSYGRVGIVSLDNPEDSPVVTSLTCDRVYASLTNGLCLQADRGVFTTYRAIAFDQEFTERYSFTLPGAPSRTRVASSAPLGASTVFVSGDSYAAGGFSTRTTIYDLEGNAIVGDLETFTVTRDGAVFKRQDFNFWGVTFGDAGRFYATLGTAGALHLVEGSVGTRTMAVIAADVECPMLSPDGSRLAYKKRLLEGGRISWRLRTIDLRTRAITDLRESRNVDDQPEWLDDDHVLYAVPREGTGSSDVWSVPADGTGEPRLFIPDAFSPAVVRPVVATSR